MSPGRTPHPDALIVVVDVGSTTTKALLLENYGGLRLLAETNVPTTVERPVEDVTRGIHQALAELERATGVTLMDADRLTCRLDATSSAGGGLQMLVIGLSRAETGLAAQRVALGAGGVILKMFTIDDGIPEITKLRLIRDLHPDLILMAGGYNDGAISGVVRLAELLVIAQPSAKFAQDQRIPLVFCGNVQAHPFIRELMEDKFDLHCVPNIRPSPTETDPEPAKNTVHALFMEKVMERAPGYARLKSMVTHDILPTPSGVEMILNRLGTLTGENIILADIGGATTDIFTRFDSQYLRTVAANIGMSYSAANVLATVGMDALTAGMPRGIDPIELSDSIANKTLYPTSLPGNTRALAIEQVLAAQGLKAAWAQHSAMNFYPVKLGFWKKHRLRNTFRDSAEIYRLPNGGYFQMWQVNMVIGAGGAISHVQDPLDALRILQEAFRTTGITRITIDRQFRSAHMGLLTRDMPENALEFYRTQCLETVGLVAAPLGTGKPGEPVVEIEWEDGKTRMIHWGEYILLPKNSPVSIVPRKKVQIPGLPADGRLPDDLPVLVDCRGDAHIPLEIGTLHPEKFMSPGEPARWVQSPRTSPIEENTEQRILRTMPYDGQVHVTTGDSVEPDTPIGENPHGPPKIFIIDLQGLVGYDNRLTPETIKQGIKIDPGDTIRMGQLIYQTPGGRVLSGAKYYSNVRGQVVRIEKNGLIILREIQDYSREPHTINIADVLDVPPSRIDMHLRVRQGDFVEAGQSLAAIRSMGRQAKAPVSGMIKTINHRTGELIIQYQFTPVMLQSYIKGSVSRVQPDRGAEIRTRADLLSGIIGFGPDTYGHLHVLESIDPWPDHCAGKIVVVPNVISAEVLEMAVTSGVRGLIAPSIRNRDSTAFNKKELGVALTGDEVIALGYFLTEGFGDIPMNPDIYTFLADRDGRLASLFCATQIRAGVTRPKLLIYPCRTG